MNKNEEALYDKIHDLVTEKIQNNGPESDNQTLQKLIVDDSSARKIYVEYIQELYHMASRLSTSHARDGQEHEYEFTNTLIAAKSESESLTQSKTSSFKSYLGLLAIAATIVLSLSWLPLLTNKESVLNDEIAKEDNDAQFNSGQLYSGNTEVATLIKTNNVVWSESGLEIQELSRLKIDQEISLAEGSLEVVFDSGVEALILAPCEVKIIDSGRIASNHGRISARVGESGKGFVVETPLARVTDLGTEFGVAVSDTGETDVAVFEGEVDLEWIAKSESIDSGTEGESISQLLYQGQALKVNTGGSLSRISSIDDRWLPNISQQQPIHSRTKVISSVQDNITDLDPELRSFYRIVHAGLREDSPAFVDRTHQWNAIDEFGLPEALIGADYVMPFNDDKYIPELEVEVDIATSAILYVFISDTVKVPTWLTNQFEDTGWNIGLDEGPGGFEGSDITLADGPGASIDTEFSVWKQVLHHPRTVILGGLEKPKPAKVRMDKRTYPGYNMYGVAAVAFH